MPRSPCTASAISTGRRRRSHPRHPQAACFLGSFFPEARVAGASESLPETVSTTHLACGCDFVLVPVPLFERPPANAVDLVTNFACFSEMTGARFDLYMRSAVIRSRLVSPARICLVSQSQSMCASSPSRHPVGWSQARDTGSTPTINIRTVFTGRRRQS